MNARLAAWLTAVHAPAWRNRYGAEFCALLEELPATPFVVASATGSALASQGPALAAIGAFVLAAAVLALGPVASDRRTVTAHAAPAHTAKPRAWSMNASCVGDVVADASGDRAARC